VTDPRRLRPGELCRLLNSTPLGEVITEQQLRQQRTRAGLRLGDSRHVDLVRYVAWLVQARHTPKPEPANTTPQGPDLTEAAQGAAAAASAVQQLKGHGQKLTSKQESLIAALLTEPTYAAAAAKAGVAPATLYRWLQLPAFQDAYRQARRKLVDAAVGRMQAGTAVAADTLLHVARHGRRDGDRVRACTIVLQQATQGLADADLLTDLRPPESAGRMDTGTVVEVLTAQLRQVVAADLATPEKSRLTAALADALLRALGVEVIDKRLEQVQAVLCGRKDQRP
jgi:hypothetical protein